MKKSFRYLIPFLLISVFFNHPLIAQPDYVQYVDPMIGTGGHGHTFPGATVPFGMVQLSPDTRVDGSWDGCSGYHYSDSIIYGFSHTHLNGTGCSDYGDIMIMPMMGQPTYDNKIYSSKFSHHNEKVSAGYYSVKLDDDNIDVELTATTRVGFHKYTFNKNDEASIILDLLHRDKLLEGSIKIVDNSTVEGIRRSEAWVTNQVVYYRISFSKPFENKKINSENKNDLNAGFSFKVKKGESVFVKVSLSTVSVEGAKKNMEAELPGWDFEKIKKDAELLWNKELSKIEITSDDKDKLKTFYTALYHTMIQPNVNMDVDGMYRGRDNTIHKAEGFTYYSVFSLWDTFRAAHPLYTIIDRKRTLDFIKTFLAQYKDGGRLPVWELASNETDCMIGYHSASVIADAATKGINDFDLNLALEAMKKSATWNHLGLPAYIDHGYIGVEDENESVSKTVEYAYDDWCIAQTAKLMNKQDDYDTYMKRSQYWKNVFDPATGFMRPKKNGGWLTPFEPREVNNNFTEGNSWQYTFFVPQDIDGLVKAMGGSDKFEKQLDNLFTASTKTTGREQVDISGLIGQYAQGNEPSHHMAYLYDFVGKPYKTQKLIHGILTDFYKPTPDGLIGNEDCGQMSAWYVLSSLGIYEVTPGSKHFMIGTPLFKQAKIHLENGKEFIVNANNLSDTNFYIKSTILNGRKNSESFISYADIFNGSTINFEMGAAPTSNTNYYPPMDLNFVNMIVTVPLISSASRVFKTNLPVELKSTTADCKVYYTIDGSVPTTSSLHYTSPLTIDKTSTVKAIAVNEKGEQSFVANGTFYKMPHPEWKIQINSKYNPQYTAGGDDGIIDGIHGDVNWRKGEWQGYQSPVVEAIIDLGKEQSVFSCSARFLQDSRAWILMPVKAEFYSSSDNKNFTLIATVDNTVKPEDNEPQIKDFNSTLSKSMVARYIKIKAYNFGKLPKWHQGAGGDAFIFTDEISVQ